ncbi:MAG: hypothetical protein ACR2QO_16950 [Acidimicrobiales bacterium]
MQQFRQLYDHVEFVVEYHFAKMGVDARDETGAVSTETAVLTAGLAIIAGAGVAILWQKLQANANSIPDTPPNPTGGP